MKYCFRDMKIIFYKNFFPKIRRGEKMKKTLYVFISLITTYMLLFEKNVYALETSKIFSNEINMIIVMGLLWCNIIIMVIKETRRRK